MGVGKKINKLAQNEALSLSLLLSGFLILFIRIPITNIIGDVGNCYYAITFTILEIMVLFFIICMPSVISKMVELRIRKNQYRNANRVFKGIYRFIGIFSIVVALFIFFIADFWGNSVMLEPLSVLATKAIAPTIILIAIIGVYRGYFQGLGTITPTIFSFILHGLFLSVFSIVFTIITFQYGDKIAALVLNPDYGSAYGVTGISIAYGVSGLIVVFFLGFLYKLYRPRYEKQILRDRTTIHEPYQQIIHIFIGLLIPQFFFYFIFPFMKQVEQIIFSHLMKKESMETITSLYFGTYMGKYDILISIPLILIFSLSLLIHHKIKEKIEENNLGLLRDRIFIILKYTWILLIPFTTLFIALAPSLLDSLFTSNIILATKFIQIGAVTIVLYGTVLVSGSILTSLHSIKVPLINSIIAFIIKIIFLIILINNTNLTIEAILFSNIAFGFLASLFNILALEKRIHYRQEWVRSLFLPILAGMISGFLMFGLDKLLIGISNSLISILVTLPLGVLLYFILIFSLKIVNEKELRKLPGHGFYLSIAKTFRLLP